MGPLTGMRNTGHIQLIFNERTGRMRVKAEEGVRKKFQNNPKVMWVCGTVQPLRWEKVGSGNEKGEEVVLPIEQAVIHTVTAAASSKQLDREQETRVSPGKRVVLLHSPALSKHSL